MLSFKTRIIESDNLLVNGIVKYEIPLFSLIWSRWGNILVVLIDRKYCDKKLCHTCIIVPASTIHVFILGEFNVHRNSDFSFE